MVQTCTGCSAGPGPGQGKALDLLRPCAGADVMPWVSKAKRQLGEPGHSSSRGKRRAELMCGWWPAVLC